MFIINNSDVTLPVEAQQNLCQACACAEVEGNVTLTIRARYEEGVLFNVYDEQENFLFTIDTDGVVAN